MTGSRRGPALSASAVVCALLLGACTGEAEPVGAGTTAGTSSSQSTALPTELAGPAVPTGPAGPTGAVQGDPTSTVEPSVPGAAFSQTPVAPPEGPGDLAPVQPTDRPTLPPVAIERPAEVSPGLQVRLSGLEAVEVTGQGPGQLSGPALAVTVEVENEGAAPLDVAGLAVSLAYADTEAGPVEGPPADPVIGAVPARSTVSGTYVFLVPERERGSVTVRVSLASQPVAVFTGSATD